MAQVVEALAAELAHLDGFGDVAARAREEVEALAALDRELADRLAAVPEARRRIVTDHDAFAYLADRYGFTIVGVIVPGGGTAGEPSAADLAALVDVVRREGVPAVFAEHTLSPRLARALADEAGDVEVVQLFSDALGDAGSGAATYADMLRTNAERIAGALA